MLYLALLRGINVGGKNLIRMPALAACFEEQGFREVTTYIQSGNVLFETARSERAALARRIERALVASFGCSAVAVVRSRAELERVVVRAPHGFGSAPGRYRYDAIFLKEPLDARAAMQHVVTRPGVDEAHAGDGVLYFSRLAREASRSLLSRIVATPVYQSMTIRNWNTTTKLLELMQKAEARGD